MDVQLRIRRFNPELDEEPHWEEYPLQAEPSDRVLDLLHQVKWYRDGTLTFRRSCAHGVCGSDAMLINGRNRLACEYLVKHAGRRITVEPLRGVPVVKDLLVDMEAGRSLLDLSGLLIDLEDLLGCNVDVVTERGLRDRIRERVLKEAVAL